jgi:hypothetical protein
MCSLVNLETNGVYNVLNATGIDLAPNGAATFFDPSASSKGWSIMCVKSGPDKVDSIKYSFGDNQTYTAENPPFFINGDKSGTSINKFDFISSLVGTVTIGVEYFSVSGLCGSFTLTLATPPTVVECSRSRYKMFITPVPAASGWKIETERNGVSHFLESLTVAGAPSVPLPTIDERYFAKFRFGEFLLRYVLADGMAGGWGVCKYNTPIALDLDRSNVVERINGVWQIDVTGQGDVETFHEWFAPTEGILMDATIPVIGGVVTGEHLFGDVGGTFSDGFAKLGLHDGNKDGIISSDELDGFAVWIDANSNAKLEDGEVRTLASVGVHSLILMHDDHYQSFASMNDGSLMLMEDLWFARR